MCAVSTLELVDASVLNEAYTHRRTHTREFTWRTVVEWVPRAVYSSHLLEGIILLRGRRKGYRFALTRLVIADELPCISSTQ